MASLAVTGFRAAFLFEYMPLWAVPKLESEVFKTNEGQMHRYFSTATPPIRHLGEVARL